MMNSEEMMAANGVNQQSGRSDAEKSEIRGGSVSSDALRDPGSLAAFAASLESGEGMPQDKAKAAAFYRQAAELYLMAGDPSENVPEGVKMLEKACGLGDRDAMELLAMRLKTGDGVPMDKARAALLYTRAADCYFGEKETEGHMEKAAVLYQLAAELGDVRAKGRMASMLFKGLGMQQNKTRAVEIFQKAAMMGDLDSIKTLAMFYKYGESVGVNHEKAARMYKKAAEIYDNGEGVEADKAMAFQMYQAAEALDDAEAAWKLSEMYRSGEGTEKDAAKEREYLQKAVDRGSGDAIFRMACKYDCGDGVTLDGEKAEALFRDAANKGNRCALVVLALMYESAESGETDQLSNTINYLKNLRPEFHL